MLGFLPGTEGQGHSEGGAGRVSFAARSYSVSQKTPCLRGLSGRCPTTEVTVTMAGRRRVPEQPCVTLFVTCICLPTHTPESRSRACHHSRKTGQQSTASFSCWKLPLGHHRQVWPFLVLSPRTRLSTSEPNNTELSKQACGCVTACEPLVPGRGGNDPPPCDASLAFLYFGSNRVCPQAL